MNKIIFKILFTVSILFVTSSASLFASDLSVGATVWYTAWDFEWEGDGEVEYDPGFLYGPVLSFAISPDMNLSFVFLYGRFDQTVKGTGYSFDTEFVRYDSDLALNYRLGNYFKVFAGAKYIHFTWDDGEHNAIGPGVGISSVFPLGNNMFLLGYISGLYLQGEETGDFPGTEKAHEYGGNASISLAYYIPGSSTTISLGGRYQQIKIDYSSPAENYQYDSTSRFYGITLTAVHAFNI